MAENTQLSQARAVLAAKILRWAGLLVWLEAAIVAGFAGYLLWGLVSGQARVVSNELTLVILYAVAAAWLVYVGVQVRASKRWARSAAVFWQTCELFIGAQSFAGIGANYLIGAVLCVPALVALVLLFNPAVSALSRSEISGR